MTRRFRRRWPWVVVAVVLALVALAWWFPARWAWTLIRRDYPTVHASAVGGSVWDGEAQDLVVNGRRLGHLHWTLSRMAVFGHLHGRVDLEGAGVMANGHIARTGDGAIVVRQLRFRIPLAHLKVLWPSGMRLGGVLKGQVAHLQLVDDWPVQLEAHVTWQSAQVVEQGQKVMLGDLQSRWRASGGGVIQADLADAGNGPLHMQGRFVATPLGWRLDTTLRQRGHRPGLRRLLDRLGRRQPDGSVRVERAGGLAAMGKGL